MIKKISLKMVIVKFMLKLQELLFIMDCIKFQIN